MTLLSSDALPSRICSTCSSVASRRLIAPCEAQILSSAASSVTCRAATSRTISLRKWLSRCRPSVRSRRCSTCRRSASHRAACRARRVDLLAGARPSRYLRTAHEKIKAAVGGESPGKAARARSRASDGGGEHLVRVGRRQLDGGALRDRAGDRERSRPRQLREHDAQIPVIDAGILDGQRISERAPSGRQVQVAAHPIDRGRPSISWIRRSSSA